MFINFYIVMRSSLNILNRLIMGIRQLKQLNRCFNLCRWSGFRYDCCGEIQLLFYWYFIVVIIYMNVSINIFIIMIIVAIFYVRGAMKSKFMV